MRRANHVFELIADRDNLRLAVHKALRGKRAKGDARAFTALLDENLNEMRIELLEDRLPVGVYHQFMIFDPKERLITAPCFRERVLHHAIMNVCEPVFENWLISDTFACRKNKGRIAALQRARLFSERFPFFLKLDIRKYFDSVSHRLLIARLHRLLKDRPLLRLFERIIEAYETAPRRGLPIGSLTSQHFANFYLGWFDRFVKESLRVRGYVRYMDDCVLWGDSAADLRRKLDETRTFLSTRLDLIPKASPYINRTGHGLDYLGCRVFPGRMLLNRRSRVRFRRKLMAFELSFARGRLDEAELQKHATALVAFTQTDGVSAWRFRRRVLKSWSVDGHRGLEPGEPGRRVEQQPAQRPFGEP